MKHTSMRCARILGALALGLAGAAAAPAQGNCNCEDVLDLQARYCQARGAIQEWDRLINWSTGKVERKQSVERFTITNKAEVAQCVDEAIGMVRDQFTGNSGSHIDTPKVGGETGDSNCQVSIKAHSACMRDVIDKHEQVHRHTCEGIKKAGEETGGQDYGYVLNFVARNVSWRLSYSLTSYMVEERTGYSTEMADTQRKLEELSQRCPRSLFERKTPKGMVFSLTPCPNPDPEQYRAKRKCQRLP